MTSCLIVMLCLSLPADSLPNQTIDLKNDYKKHLVISGIVGIGLGFVCGVYHLQGNKAYYEYQNTTSLTDAVKYWEKTARYDAVRNISALGSLVFITRTFFYYYKLRGLSDSEQSKTKPVINIDYNYQGKWLLAIQKKF